MRSFVTALFFVLRTFATTQQPRDAFPIPNMHETWPGAKLDAQQRSLLQRSMAADVGDQGDDPQSGKKYSSSQVDSAEISLGTLGNGVIVIMSGSAFCGTGGCPIYVYVREKAGYRKVLNDSLGWAFAVVDSKTAVPNLVIASNAGGGQIVLTVYAYAEKSFQRQSCETLTSKDGRTPDSWWDAEQVNIQPCAIN